MEKKIITMKFFLHKKERFFLKVGERLYFAPFFVSGKALEDWV